MVDFINYRDLPLLTAAEYDNTWVTTISNSTTTDVSQTALSEIGDAILQDTTVINAQVLTLSGVPLVDYYALEATYGIHTWGVPADQKFWDPAQKVYCDSATERRNHCGTVPSDPSTHYNAFTNILVDTIYRNEVVLGTYSTTSPMGLALDQSWMNDELQHDYVDYGNYFLVQSTDVSTNPGGDKTADLFKIMVGPSELDDYTDASATKVVIGNPNHPTVLGLVGEKAQISVAGYQSGDRVLELGYMTQENGFIPWAIFDQANAEFWSRDSSYLRTNYGAGYVTLQAPGVATYRSSVQCSSQDITMTSPAIVDTTLKLTEHTITLDPYEVLSLKVNTKEVLSASDPLDETYIRNPSSTSYIKFVDEEIHFIAIPGTTTVYKQGVFLPTLGLQMLMSVSNYNSDIQPITPTTTTMTFATVQFDDRSVWTPPATYTCEFTGYYTVNFSAFFLYSPLVTSIKLFSRVYHLAVYRSLEFIILESNAVPSWDSRAISWTQVVYIEEGDLFDILVQNGGAGGPGQFEIKDSVLTISKFT